MYNEPTAPVAQLVRALPCHGRGHGFESHRARKRFMSKGIYTVILFYKFAHIAKPDVLAEKHRDICSVLGFKGRMIVGEEGVNATFEGTTKNINKYLSILKKDSLFKNVLIKKSLGNGSAFPRLTIKVRDEIVTLGAGKFNIKKETARKLSAKELEKWYKQDKDFVVLDLEE